MRSGALGWGFVAAFVALSGCSDSGDGGGGGDGGGTPTPAITVAPKTATRTAGGPAVAFTATLSGGASGTIAWTLDPAGVGSLSATTGATTSYTPPDTVAATTAVTVTATAGALSDSATVTVQPATPAITVAPKTATRTAGGPPVAFTATLSGGASGTIAWTLDPAGVGSLSATTGATTSYTPPDTVAATTAVTVTATAGALSDSATVTVEPAGGGGTTVAGTVLDANGDPISGVKVSANGGAAVTTGADGGFTIGGVTVPYELAAVWNAPGFVVGVVFDGLSRIDPVVSVPFSEAAAPTSTATFEGVVSGPPQPLPVGSQVFFSAGAPEVVLTSGALTDPAGGPYFGDVEWLGTGNLAATLHAMYVDDPFDPTAYWHGTRSLALAPAGAAVDQDLVLSQLPTGDLSVTATLPAGLDCAGAGSPCDGALFYFAQFTDGASFDGGIDPFTTSPSTFVSVTPDLTGLGGSLSLTAATSNALGATSTVFQSDVPATATVTLSPRAPPVPTAPADDATGVGPGTVFSWTAAPFADGVHTLTVTHAGIVPRSLYVFTEATSVVLPDLAALGLELPPIAPVYAWTVISVGPATVDDLAGPAAPTAATSYLATSVQRTFER